MSDVVKKVHRLVPSNERSQTFTEADASAGDVIMVKDSLGRPARKVFIEADDPISLRPNVYQYIFPLRESWEDDFGAWNPGERNMALGQRVKDNEGVSIDLEAGGSLELDHDIPVSDLELLTVSGLFTITVM